MISSIDLLSLANTALAALPSIPSDRAGFKEATCRMIVSRSYYAVYHKARSYAESNQYSKRDGIGFHEDLWEWYAEKAHDGIVSSAESLLEARVAADYYIWLDSNENVAKQQLELAGTIIKSINMLEKTDD